MRIWDKAKSLVSMTPAIIYRRWCLHRWTPGVVDTGDKHKIVNISVNFVKIRNSHNRILFVHKLEESTSLDPTIGVVFLQTQHIRVSCTNSFIQMLHFVCIMPSAQCTPHDRKKEIVYNLFKSCDAKGLKQSSVTFSTDVMIPYFFHCTERYIRYVICIKPVLARF